MYADNETLAIKHTISITEKRRKIQEEYNIKNNIVPKTITKSKIETIEETFGMLPEELPKNVVQLDTSKEIKTEELEKHIKALDKEMKKAAKELRFEDAAKLRDMINYYQNLEFLK